MLYKLAVISFAPINASAISGAAKYCPLNNSLVVASSDKSNAFVSLLAIFFKLLNNLGLFNNPFLTKSSLVNINPGLLKESLPFSKNVSKALLPYICFDCSITVSTAALTKSVVSISLVIIFPVMGSFIFAPNAASSTLNNFRITSGSS